jgi:hypothetical protein
MKSLFVISLILLRSIFTFAQDTSFENSPARKKFGIGFNTGLFMLKADIPGIGVANGLNFHLGVNSTLSLRLNTIVGSAKGLSAQPWRSSRFGGGLVESVYSPYANNVQGWFPSYKYEQTSIQLEGLLSLTRLIAKQIDADFRFIDLHVIGGYGIFFHITSLDLLDGNQNPYPTLIGSTSWTPEKYDSKNGRKSIRNQLTKIYDGKYETQSLAIATIHTYSYGASLRFNISPNFGVGLEAKIIKYPGSNYADGIRFRTADDISTNEDSALFLSVLAQYKL